MAVRRLKPVLIVVAPVLLMALLLGGWLSHELGQGVVEDTILDVDRGSNLSEISLQLTSNGTLPVSELVFKVLALATRNDGSIKAGQYALRAGMNSAQVLALIRSGKVIAHRVTFPEGFTFEQWRKTLSEAPYLTSMTQGLTRSQIAQLLDISGDPEGWLFPDTYQYIKGDSDIEILLLATNRMRAVLSERWERRNPEVSMRSPYEAIILASIIEKETAAPADRGKVASVFHNRLRLGMRLQSDPTVIYGLGNEFDGDLKRVHLRSDTPYNSYTRHGLPPTPICSPGLAAIEAALAGSYHPYLYFVARGDGTSAFSLNLAEHNQAVRTYQKKMKPKTDEQ